MQNKKLYLTFFLLIMTVNLMFLSPLLDSGLVGDDYWRFSVVKGMGLLQDKNVVQLTYEDMLSWIRAGRWFPLSSYRIPLFYYLDRVPYKATMIAAIMISIILLGYFMRLISGSKWLALMTLLWPPLFLQTRIGSHDPILAYHFFIELLVIFLLLSLILFIKFLQQRRYLLLFGSLLCYISSLLIYEAAYTFCLLHMLTALIILGPQKIRFAVKSCMPFIFLTAANMAFSIFLRCRFGVSYEGVKLNISFMPWLITLLRQIYAALPLSGCAYSSGDVLRCLRDGGAADILAVCSIWAILWYFISYKYVQELATAPYARIRNVWILFGIGLWVLPGTLVALSCTHQKEIAWWGDAYLPVYISYFGVMIILSVLITAAWNLLKVRQHFGGLILVVFLGAVGTVTVGINYCHNKLNVLSINHVTLHGRQVAIDALRDDLLKFVPNHSYLVAPWPIDPRFVRLYGGRTLQITRPLMALADKVIGTLLPETVFHSFASNDEYIFDHLSRPFMLRFEAFPPNGGYAVLANLDRLFVAASSIQGAASTELYLYWRRPPGRQPHSIWVVGDWLSKSSLQSHGSFKFNASDLDLVRVGSVGNVYRIPPHLIRDYVDVNSLFMFGMTENVKPSSFPTGLSVSWSEGFYDEEEANGKRWRWSDAVGRLKITNSTNSTLPALLDTSVLTSHLEMSTVTIESDIISASLKVNSEGVHLSEWLNVPPGEHIVTWKCDAPRLMAPHDPRRLVFTLNDFRLSTAKPPLEQTVTFGENATGLMLIDSGFSQPEKTFTWTSGEQASIRFTAPPITGDLEMTLNAIPFEDVSWKKRRFVDVFCDETHVARWPLVPNGQGMSPTEYKARINKSLVKPGQVQKISFRFNETISPKMIGMSEDSRLLGLAFTSMVLRELPDD